MTRREAGRAPGSGGAGRVRLGFVLGALMALGLAFPARSSPLAGPDTRGIEAESITAIYQDRAGFLWIGSREGLWLYDGLEFVAFEHDVADPTSISDNTVRTIFEDRDGNLWLGTNSGGLNRLDRATWRFEQYRHDSADPRSLSHDSVNVVSQDRTGAVWVGTQIGLNRLDVETGTFERFMADPSDPTSLSHDYVYAIHEDGAGALWVGTVGGGLNRRDPETGEFTVLRHDPDDPHSLSNDEVFAIAESTPGELWVGTEDGLNRLDVSGGTFRRYGHDPEGRAGLRNTLVTSLVADRSGTLWIGTWGGGLHEFDLARGALRAGGPSGESDRRSTDRIVAIHEDRSGALWVGSWAGGLRRLQPVRGASWTLDTPARAGAPGASDATAVLESRDGTLWIGTWGRGLIRRDPELESFVPYPKSAAMGTGTVLEIHEDVEGRLWLGRMDGLLRLEPDTGAVEAYRYDPGSPAGLGAGYVTAILQDRDRRLWVGVGGSGLHRLREDGRTFDRFVHDPQDPNTPSDDYVTALLQGGDGTLWVGTRSGGLNAFHPDSGGFARYLPDPGDDTTIGHHYVTSILEDRRGVLWVGTAGGGLNRLDREGERERFRRITERDGLIDDNVMAIAEDDDGTLWLGTKRGLSRFDPSNGAFANYDTSDGLPTTEFNVGSAWAGRSRLYFGTSKGAVGVPRGMPFPEPEISPTVLRTIRTPDGPVRAEAPAWKLERLSVPYGELLSFGFVVLDYGDPRRHRYAYRLGGVRDEWIELGTRREITFTDLDPGVYTLEVRGQNGQGVWSEADPALALSVVPPFWMTAWFRGMLVLVLVGTVVTVHRVRTETLKRRNRRLQALKDEREKALTEVRASEEKLQTAYGRLRGLTRRLEAVKEGERKRVARELHDEMGQALTAAKINLQLLPQIPDAEEKEQRIRDTVGLVDRMIHHVRALSLDLRPPLLDELGLVPAVRGYLEAQAQRSGLEIQVESRDLSAAGLSAEVEITGFRVIQEAVTNVIRHAGARRVRVEVLPDRGCLAVSIRDDGRGFPVEETLDGAAVGGHVGLLGMRERVQALGGQVEVESGPGSGTAIRARIPLTP